MKTIIYFSPNDIEKFDFKRYKNSLNSYALIPEEKIKEALKEYDIYENMHVSLLVKTGVRLIDEFG